MAPRSDCPVLRRALRVLQMVHELHKRGYQRLRIMPGMSPSGAEWRVAITPVSNILRSDGAIARSFDPAAHYSTADDNHYFGWDDAESDTASDLADKFARRFPVLVQAGSGKDWAYAGWYVEMLGLAEYEALPLAYDERSEDPPAGHMRTTIADIMLLCPPPGEAGETKGYLTLT